MVFSTRHFFTSHTASSQLDSSWAERKGSELVSERWLTALAVCTCVQDQERSPSF